MSQPVSLPGGAIRGRRALLALMLVAASLMLVCVSIMSNRALETFNRELVPSFDKEAGTVGGAIAVQIQRALVLGVPLGRLQGVTEYLQPFLQQRASLTYIVLADPQGQILAEVGRDLEPLRQALETGKVALPDIAVASARESGTPTAVTVLAGVRNSSVAILNEGRAVAFLHLGVDRQRHERQIDDVRWDVGVLLLVAILTTFELLLFLVDRSLVRPMSALARVAERAAAGDWTMTAPVGETDEVGRLLRASNEVVRRVNNAYARLGWKLDEVARDGAEAARKAGAAVAEISNRYKFAIDRVRSEAVERRAVIARTPLFLFIFAEQMSMSFMPLYAKQLYAPVSFLSEGYLLGAPLVAFVAVIALATPFAGSWVQRWGSRRIFVAGALPAVIGYVCAALAESIPQLIGARVLCALGYAMITISCQSYLADMVRSNRQTRDMSVFVMAVMTGVVCGAAIGAVLADRLGFRWTFACSAVLVLIASLCAGATMSNDRPPESERPIGVVRGMRYAFGEARFTALVFLAAVPAKLVLNGFLYYLTPLYLASLAISQPEIGRTIMMYGICMLVSIWVGARVADRFGHLPWQIGLSGLATGLGGLAVFALPPTQAILVAVIVLGLAQGFSSGPLLALVPRVSGAAAEMVGVQPMLGLLRSFERIGSILGPVIAATLVVAGGYINAVAWLSGIAAVTGVLFLVVFQLRGSK